MMLKPVRLALGIAVAGGVAFLLAEHVPGWGAFVCWWIATACFTVAVAYALNLPDVFGKRDGLLSRPRILILFPYMLAFRLACALMRWRRRLPSISRITPTLYVGGRLGPADLPVDTAIVVDLAAELSEPLGIRAHPGYRSHPVLDGCYPPDDDAFLALLDEIAATRGVVVVHCESGKGRAPTAAALVLVARGEAPDAAAALATIRRGRPWAAPTTVDLRFMERMDARLAERRPQLRLAPVPQAGAGEALQTTGGLSE